MAKEEQAEMAIEMVTIKIPKDPMNEGDTIVDVGINGVFYHLERGEKIEVLKHVGELLEVSDDI